MRSPLVKSIALALSLANAAVASGCAGSSSPAVPGPTPSPPGTPIVSNGTLAAAGAKGVGFTFTFRDGVPPNEFAVVTPLPPPPPCSGTACTAVQAPLDGIQIRIGPQPLPVGTLANLALTGVVIPSALSMWLSDAADPSAFSNFRSLGATGGPIVIIDPASPRPVLTLSPDRLYAIALYQTTIPF